MEERPCDCAGHHLRFPERSRDAVAYELLHPPTRVCLQRPIPDVHQHEDARCSKGLLGIGGCPGLPHCRDWILGMLDVCIYLAEASKDGARFIGLSEHRKGLEREFASRSSLEDAP